MAIEYGAFIVDGLDVKKQTLSLAGQTIGFTDARDSQEYKTAANHSFLPLHGSDPQVGSSSRLIPTTSIRHLF